MSFENKISGKTVLLALDLQRHMVHADSPLAQHIGFAEQVASRQLLRKVDEAIAASHAANVPVVFVVVDHSLKTYRHPETGQFGQLIKQEYEGGKVLQPGNWESEIHEAIQVGPQDRKVPKAGISAFSGSELEQVLKALDVTHLVLLGVATNFVVQAMAWGAIERGYDVTILEDASAAGDAAVHEATLRALSTIADIGDVASYGGWLKQP